MTDAAGRSTIDLLPEPRVDPQAATEDSGETSAAAAGQVPTHLGRYLLMSRLGAGGMGVVFEAFDPELDRRVAVKLLRPGRGGATHRLRLLREAQAMARLSHPNVVQVYDVGVVGKDVFVAMELVRGRTVAQWLVERERTWVELVAVFVAAARGIVAAHEAGVVHRDLKPENILLSDAGRVCVADFGVASYCASADPPSSPAPVAGTASYLTANLTRPGNIVGTPKYMSPEQHAGESVGAATDQFSFCVALYEAMYDRLPYGRLAPREVDAHALAGRRPRRARRRAPRWLRRVLARGMATRPAHRFPSMADLLASLERGRKGRRRRWSALALALPLAGVAAAIAALSSADPCSAGARRLDGDWDAARRTALVGAFERRTVPSPELASAALDKYAAQWVAANEQTCRAHHEGRTSSGLMDAGIRCLERRRHALRNVVDLGTEADARVLVSLPEAIDRLPAVALCLDHDRLLARGSAPVDPATARRVAVLEDRLTRAEVLHSVGSIGDATRELGAVRREANGLGYKPLQAEIALATGRVAMLGARWAEARASLQSAATLAVAAGDDHVAAEAVARAVFAGAMDLGETQAALIDHAWGEALLERAGRPPAVAALLSNNVGVVHRMRGDQHRAVTHFAEAVALAREAAGVSAVDRTGYMINLAMNTADPTTRQALLRSAGGIVSAAFGPAHPRAVDIILRRAEHAASVEEARDLFAQACARMSDGARHGYARRHTALMRLAEAHDELGDGPAAASAAAAAIAALAADVPEAERDYAAAATVKATGLAHVLQGEFAAALPPLAEARRRFEEHGELPWIQLELADVQLLEGRALTALGRAAEARPGLRTALRRYQELMLTSHDTALPRRAARARALAEAH